MLRWNNHTRTLEQEEHHFELQDIAEPNLFRDTFPYVEVPRIPFNHRRVPMWPPDGNLDHRHHLPRRPAGPPALHRRADRPALHLPAPTSAAPTASSARASSSSTPTRTSEAVRALPRPGLPLPRDHRLDPRHRQPTSSSSRRWASRKPASSPPAPTTTSSSSSARPASRPSTSTSASSRPRSSRASSPAATSRTSPAPTSTASSSPSPRR